MRTALKLMILGLFIFASSCSSDESGPTENPNTAPTISAIGNIAITFSSTSDSIIFTISDNETLASDLTVSVSSSNSTVLPVSNISLGGSGSKRHMIITASANIGNAAVTVTVSDGSLSASETFDVTIVDIQTYSEAMTYAWLDFENKQYASAASKFKLANGFASDSIAAYEGWAWALFKIALYDSAENVMNSSTVFTIDMAAISAFLENARKDFSESNDFLYDYIYDGSGLVTWSVAHGLNLNEKHLYLTEAQNYFAYGNSYYYFYAEKAIQKIDSSFNVDENTAAGQEALALKIEELLSTL